MVPTTFLELARTRRRWISGSWVRTAAGPWRLTLTDDRTGASVAVLLPRTRMRWWTRDRLLAQALAVLERVPSKALRLREVR